MDCSTKVEDYKSLTTAEPGIAADRLQFRSFLAPLSAAAEFGRWAAARCFTQIVNFSIHTTHQYIKLEYCYGYRISHTKELGQTGRTRS